MIERNLQRTQRTQRKGAGMTEEDAILSKFMEKCANEPFVLFVSFVAKTMKGDNT